MPEVLIDLGLEEVVHPGVALHLLLPLRTLELLCLLHDVLEVVEGEGSRRESEDKQRKEGELEVRLRDDPHLGLGFADGAVFQAKVVHLQVDLVLACVDWIVDLLLEGYIILKGFCVDEDGAGCLHPIVTDRVKVALSICQEWHFSGRKANLEVPRSFGLWILEFLADLHKGHVIFLQIYLASNSHKGHHLDIYLSVDSDSNCALFFVDFVLKPHVVFHLVEDPAV